jgi:hypothetical protein
MFANFTVMLNIVLSIAKFILCILTRLRQFCTEQVLCDKDRTPKKVLYPNFWCSDTSNLTSILSSITCPNFTKKYQQAQVMGHLERRILEVNRKRIKVVKPGSKTSFPTTEARGTYTPPFHVSTYHDNMYFFSRYTSALQTFRRQC